MTSLTRTHHPTPILVAFVLAALIPSPINSAATPPASTPQSATLRIGLWTLWHDKQITVAPSPGNSSTLRLCDNCPATLLSHPTRIRATANRLVLDGNHQVDSAWLTGPVSLSAHSESLTLSNPLHITARFGQLVIAVTLPVETYVERVVASESGPADSPESLKALAIAVRSFALHQAHGHADYDLCDSTHCQLLHWAGNSARQPAAHAAALTTAGETLWFRGQRAQAWFHQNCGGRTASPSEIWPATARKPMPWLTSRADNYCTSGGTRQWSADLSLSDLTAALAAQGFVRPGWKTLTIDRRGESGRAVMLLAGSTRISAEDFRLAVGRALGWDRILSTWFEVAPQGDHFLFHGRGSGHGVGLCQAGAAVMAAQGLNLNQILAQYFSGAIAVDESTGKSWQSIPSEGFQLQTLSPADAQYLPQLSQALAEARNRSEIRSMDTQTVRAFPSTPAFRDATLAPGWVAAFTEGNWTATQPLHTLSARKLLVPILRHEFLHALVESQAAPNAPLWLREGLIELWAGDAKPSTLPPTLKLAEVDRALTRSATEAQSTAAHRAAAWYAARLLNRFGRAQVLAWLRSGLPADAMTALG